MLKRPKKLRRGALAPILAAVLTATLPCGGPSSAQILGGRLPGLPSLPGGLPDTPRAAPLGSITGPAGELAGATLSNVRRLTAQRLLRDHRDVVEADDQGRPVVRGDVMALGIAPETLARLQQAGFTVRSRDTLPGLGFEAVTLGAPKGLSAAEAVRRVRALDPGGQYDFDHLYQEGGATGAGAGPTAGEHADEGGLRVGMVDGSAAQSRPALAGARLVQRAFAPGGARTTAHATAVASLIARAAPGAEIDVADVYGPTPTGGSALALVRALDWLAQTGTPVINISLVGPPNTVLAAAVKAALGRGLLLVAPVGNDGPAAPPLYPAAYPGVIAVTGVDGRRRVLPEAGRAGHVDFAAPGEVSAAAPGGGFANVRGTSFAAPLVAGRLAVQAARVGPTQAVQALSREAADPNPAVGRGVVGFDLRLAR